MSMVPGTVDPVLQKSGNYGGVNRMSDRTHWHTGGIVRLCKCGTGIGILPKVVKPELKIYTDGDFEYAYCSDCKKRWRYNETLHQWEEYQ